MRLLAAAISLAVGSPQKPKPDLDVDCLLWAARQVEGARENFVHPNGGARGVYQLREITWRQHSRRPFEWASSSAPEAVAETRRVAEEHARWIIRDAIPALRIPATPYSFGLVWRVGYGNVERLNLTPANVDFARRLSNLYEDRK